MYSSQDIRQLHLEITTECNAACPLCPRNFYGKEYNDGYPLHSMTLAEVEVMFPPSFVQQLTEIIINGNFGDIVMNPEALDILRYFRTHGSCSPDLQIKVSTNGSARSSSFWAELAKLKVYVIFAIDGLESTHSRYRRNTSWNRIITNAKTFIKNDTTECGLSTWKFIKFDHNKHEINQATQMAQELGFTEFELVDHGRDTGPVFNDNGEFVDQLGTPKETNFDQLFQVDDKLCQAKDTDYSQLAKHKNITCLAKAQRSLYVTATGDAYPCCFTGFYPKTYGHIHNSYHQISNAQLRDIVHENNILKWGLQHAIEWFSYIEKSWEYEEFNQGRLIACNNFCGES